MATTVSELNVVVSADTRPLETGLAHADKSVSGFGSALKSGLGMGLGFGAIGAAVGLVGTAFSAAKGSVIDLNGSLEQSQIAFTTMLGSGEKAEAFLGDLQKFAAATPFEFPDLVQASKRMLAFGFDAKSVIPLMTAVGDAVAAVGGGAETIDGVTTALGQMQAKGKVSAEEMGQLAERGIPAWQMLADKLGVSVADAMEMVSKGQVKAGTMIEAFQEGSAKRFGGMMEKQSQTWSGALSTIKDSLSMATAKAFQPFFKIISEGAIALAGFLQGETFTAWASTAATAIEGIVQVLRGLWETISGGENTDALQLGLEKIFGQDSPIIGGIMDFVFAVADAGQALMLLGRYLMATAEDGDYLNDWLGHLPEWTQPAALAIGHVVAFLRDVVAAIPAVVTALAGLFTLFSGGEWTQDLTEAFVILAETFGFDSALMIVEWATLAGEAFRSFGAFVTEQLGVVVSWVQENWPLIQQTIATVLAAISAFWEEHGGTIITVVQSAWTIVKEVIGQAIDVVLSLLKAGMQAINGDWSGAWQTLTGLFERTMMRIGTILGAIVTSWAAIIDDATGGMLTSIGRWLSDTADSISRTWEFVKLFTQASWNAVLEFFGGILPAIEEAFSSAWQSIGDTLQGAWDGFTSTIQGALDGIQTAIRTVWEQIPEDIRQDLELIARTLLERGREWVENVTTTGSNMLTAITGKLGEIVEAVTTWATTTVLDPIKGLVTSATSTALEVGSGIWTSITTKLDELVTAVTTWATNTFISPITALVGTATTEATNVGSGILTSITTKIGEAVTAVTTFANDTFITPLRNLVETARSTASSIGTAIVEGIRSAVTAGAESLANAAAAIVRRAIAAAKSAVGVAGVEYDGERAAGGPVRAGGMYLVGENGPELFAPFANGTIIPNGRLSAPTLAPAMASIGGVQTMRLDVAIGGKVAEQIVVQGYDLAVKRGWTPAGLTG